MDVWVLWEEVPDSDSGTYSEPIEVFTDHATAAWVCNSLNDWSEWIWPQAHRLSGTGQGYGPYQWFIDAYGRENIRHFPSSPRPWSVGKWEVR